MGGLRKHASYVSIVVIAVMLASPLARAFCQLFVNPAEAAIALAAVNCVSDKSKEASGAGLPAGQHTKSTHCAVCLALSSATVPAPSSSAIRSDWDYLEPVQLSSAGPVRPHELQLGGVGSRAPPFRA